MKSCEEAPDHFLHFLAMAENFSDRHVKILRVDNMPELVCGRLEHYCSSRSITYEKTVPDSPSQNSMAEHCNLMLVSMACTMLLDTNLSSWYWPFAIEAAVHLKNRVPHRLLLPHKTPFEFWYNQKPDLSHLCLFSSSCVSRILSTTSSKFEPQGEHARFLGYAKNAKGYILSVANSNGVGRSIKICCDVCFCGFSPRASSQSDDNQSPLWDNIPQPDRVYGSYASFPFS
jgi:hypothetical protein